MPPRPHDHRATVRWRWRRARACSVVECDEHDLDSGDDGDDQCGAKPTGSRAQSKSVVSEASTAPKGVRKCDEILTASAAPKAASCKSATLLLAPLNAAFFDPLDDVDHLLTTSPIDAGCCL